MGLVNKVDYAYIALILVSNGYVDSLEDDESKPTQELSALLITNKPTGLLLCHDLTKKNKVKLKSYFKNLNCFGSIIVNVDKKNWMHDVLEFVDKYIAKEQEKYEREND